MRRLFFVTALISLGLVLTAFARPKAGCCGPEGAKIGPALGQQHRMEMRHEMRQERMREMMEEGSRVTIRGRVASIEYGPRGGMKVMVESDSRLTPVIIGPVRPTEIKEDLQKNDRVEVTGRRVMRDGQSAIIARKIQLEGESEMITLRPHDAPPPDKPHRMMMKQKRMRQHAY